MDSKEILRLVQDEVYSRHYQLNPNMFNGHKVTLFAECSKNPDYQANNDDRFLLEFHFSVDNYAPREHLVGFFIGREGMSKQEIDETIDRYAFDQVTDDFHPLVAQYLQKEFVWQNMLDEQNEEEEIE